MPINLVRNSKVFFTTNVDADGKIRAASATAYTATNIQEIQVLEGFTFSQNVNNETVTLSEAGVAPVRGQRSFNTSLAPVDFSFSTYIRPRNQTSKITAEEAVLWNALLSDSAITYSTVSGVSAVTASATGLVTIAGTGMTNLPTAGDVITLSGIATVTAPASPTGLDKFMNGSGTVTGTPSATSITVQLFNFHPVAITTTTLVTASTVKWTKASWSESNTVYSQATAGTSDKNQLQKFGMLFLVDNVLYAVDNCALNQVTVDFGLDQIATAQWSGQATALRQFATGVTATAGSFAGGTTADVSTGAYQVKDVDAKYITNKLSTVALSAVKAIGGSVAAGASYSVPITGGSFTINNNITYITPANLGTVNLPVTYYTGTRAITGTLNAYLRTGTSNETGELLADLLAESATSIEPMFALSINIGGTVTGTAAPKVVIELPSITLGIPSIDVQQVVSTSINFTAQGYVPSATAASNVFDLTKPTDLAVRYHA